MSFKVRQGTGDVVAALATPVHGQPKTKKKKLDPTAGHWPAPLLQFEGWNDSSFRELAGHLAEHGIKQVGDDALDLLRAAELAKAVALDARVTGAQMDKAIARAQQAARLEPLPQVDLFGFSRLIDARFKLDDHSLDKLASRALDRRRGASNPVKQETLFAAINNGPRDGATVWRRPVDKVQLVASLVRHLVLGKGASLQLRLSPELAHWLEDVLGKNNIPLIEAMGGAGAFCANLASVLPQVVSHFYASEDTPDRVLAQFGGGVHALDHKGEAQSSEARADHDLVSRVNYVGEFNKGAFQIFGHDKLAIDSVERPLENGARGRIILGTPGTQRATFGDMSDAALKRVGKEHDLFFLVGTHYHSDAPPGTSPDSEVLARQLDVMKSANPKLLVHLQYVEPKVSENEHLMLSAMRGRVSSMSLNSVELAGLLGRMADAKMVGWAGKRKLEREEAEHPSTMLDGASALKAGMGLSRVHLHGSLGDMLIVDKVKDPERQVLALLRARQIASVKSGNPKGHINSASDLFPVAPIVEGAGLAAVQTFADALAAKFPAIDDKARALIVERWWYRDPATGQHYFFVPSRGIHDASGGTLSLGDTIDSSALIFGLETDRPRRLVHPRSFARPAPEAR